MPEITAFDRVMAVINGKLPDRVPVIPQLTYTTAQITGVDLVEALHSPQKTAEALLAGQRELGYDAIYVGWESSFNLLAEAMGCTMRYPKDSVPQVVKHIIQVPNDIDQLKIPDPLKTGRLPLHMNLVTRVKSKVREKIPLFAYTPGPFTLAGQLCGINPLMAATIKDSKFVHEITEIAFEASIRYALANIDAGIDVIVIADPTASGSLISPKTFETFAAPHQARLAKAIIHTGAIASLHICGKTTALLELMAGTGVKLLELDYLVDMVEAKQRVGDQVILMGNLEPSDLLLSGTSDAVEAAAKACIEAVGTDGRYILSSGCEVPPHTPLDNIRAMVRAARKYGRFT